jgi:iron(III) transport system permease protein
MARRARSHAAAAWLVAAGVVALAVTAPLAGLATAAARGTSGLWTHLLRYVLPGALADTAVLLLGVGVITALVGTATAWLVTAFEFPGRRWLQWALLLPLATPTYVVAYAYLDLLHPVGPVQSALRAVLGYDSPRDFRLPDVRSMTGCILLLSAVLYPYVYATVRAMLLTQAATFVDAARTLGTGGIGVFWRVVLPMARPAVAAGVALALFEALNDIGAAEFLGVRTLTVSIYATWVTRSDLPGAAQMALAMLAVVIAIVWLERRARRHRRYANDARLARPLSPVPLYGWRTAAAVTATATPVAIGFLAPAVHLLHAAVDRLATGVDARALAAQTASTVAFAAAATLAATVAGLTMGFAGRVRPGAMSDALTRLGTIGYAVPGTVLAIGLLPVLAAIDDGVERFGALLGASWPLFTLGTGAAVVYACTARFLAVAIGGVESGLARVPASIDDAGRTLGASAGQRLWRLYLPLVRPATAAAALLVFVDAMKELPATLLLRPIGVETLATYLYGEAARGTYEDGAIAALLIVAVGALPVRLMARIGAVGPSSP